MVAVHVALESGPVANIGSGVGRRNPNATNVVNVPFVGNDIWVVGDYLVFVDGKVKRCIVASWWCTHSGTVELMPGGIAEGEDIQLHDKAECGHQCVNWYGAEGGLVSTKVRANFP